MMQVEKQNVMNDQIFQNSSPIHFFLFLGAAWLRGYPLDDKRYSIFCVYTVFGLEDGRYRDSHFWLKTMVEHMPQKCWTSSTTSE
jgi:hypothetical protein